MSIIVRVISLEVYSTTYAGHNGEDDATMDNSNDHSG